MVTAHLASLSGLSANSLYHYRVKSRDAAGNLATSVDFTFTTASPTPPPTGDSFYVATNGNDANPGTQAQPFRTLSKAVSVLTPGDVLFVRAGSYTGSSQLGNIPSGSSWSAPVTIKAFPGETVTILAQQGQIGIFFNNGNHHIIVDGFIVDATNGLNGIKVMQGSHHIRIMNTEIKNAPFSGINVSPDPGSTDNEFINCVVHDNGTRAQFDHGIYISNARNLIDGCLIYNNSAYGIHIYSGDDNADNIVRNSRVHSQGNKAGILLGTGQGHKVYNNLVYGNAWGIALFYGGGGSVYNNTIHDNGVGVYVCCDATQSNIENNLIYGNNGLGIYVEDASVGLQTIRNNLSSHNSSGNFRDLGGRTTLTGNLIGDQYEARFVNAAARDYRLTSGSNAINTGLAISGLTNDFFGNSRPRGGGYDIGAHEF
jgi:parallel beta-helix repeat protein